MNDQDYSELQYLINSASWQLVADYIQAQIKSLQGDLERGKFTSLDQVTIVQGKLQAYRSVLELPDTRMRAWQKKQEV